MRIFGNKGLTDACYGYFWHDTLIGGDDDKINK